MEKTVDIRLSAHLKDPSFIPKLQATQLYNFLRRFRQTLLTYYPVD